MNFNGCKFKGNNTTAISYPTLQPSWFTLQTLSAGSIMNMLIMMNTFENMLTPKSAYPFVRQGIQQQQSLDNLEKIVPSLHAMSTRDIFHINIISASNLIIIEFFIFCTKYLLTFTEDNVTSWSLFFHETTLWKSGMKGTQRSFSNSVVCQTAVFHHKLCVILPLA